MRRVTVALTPPYDVVIGNDVLDEVGNVLANRRRVAVVSAPGVPAAHVTRVLDALTGNGVSAEVVEMGDGEDAKTLATVQTLGRALTDRGIGRADALVAVGGGVVGDTAGFVASVYHRGIDVVQVPTTLLAQVDAAIGGKTAVNLPEGKNLLGSFHQPVAVIADAATLATLSATDFRCGLGEVAKYALMPQGADVTRLLDTESAAVLARDPAVLADVVTACASIKATLVAADPRERTGARATLNYGHTLGHALEITSGHALAHGEAVAIGLVFAVTLAACLERVPEREVDRVLSLLTDLGLPMVVPSDSAVSAEDLMLVMSRDKKAHGGVTFVLPGPDGLTVVDDPPWSALEKAFGAVGVIVGS
jgi:3-dehydroquinate synthase